MSLPLLSGLFPPTRWTLIRLARSRQAPWADMALNELCALYRKPVYRYLRQLGKSHEDAEDYTQMFFVKAIKDALFEKSDPEQGRLRSLITVALNCFVIDQGRRRKAVKRGGKAVMVPGDITELESLLHEHLGQGISPDVAFARQCCTVLLEEVHAQLEERYRRRGKLDLFHALELFIPKPSDGCSSQKEAARALGMTPNAFWNRLQDLRDDYQRLLVKRIAQTVTPDQLEDEIRFLQGIF